MSPRHQGYLKSYVRCCKIWSRQIAPIITAIEKLAKKAGKPKGNRGNWSFRNQKIAGNFEKGLWSAFKEIDKKKRSTAISGTETQCKKMFVEDEAVIENQAMSQLKSLTDTKELQFKRKE